MYRLLVVDDEPWIRERLCETIDWASLGVVVAGAADDGLQALELAECMKPDIILTDIRMPVMDGLELIRGLRENGNAAKVVIISGYQDFEYAQKAIKFGAFDYILKPVDDKELMGIIRRCASELNDKSEREQRMADAQRQIEDSRPGLRELFLISLLNGRFTGAGEIATELAHLGIEAINAPCLCLAVSPDQPEPDAVLGCDLGSAIAGIVSVIAGKTGPCDCLQAQADETLCLLRGTQGEEELARQALEACADIRRAVRDSTGRTVTIGVGRAYAGLPMAPASCREAREALQYRAFLGGDSTYDIRAVGQDARRSSWRPGSLETLVNNIKAGDKHNALATVNELIASAAGGENEALPIDLKLLYINVMNAVLKTVLESGDAREEFPAYSMDFCVKLSRLQTVKEAEDWLSDAIGKVAGLYERNLTGRPRKVVSRALDYIGRHFREPLTLNSVAEQFYFNPSYFCKIFKQETGEAFTKYLINLRVARAKELLDDPKLKIYEVAAMVGYEDVQYFMKIFKAMQGVTPMTYRERVK